MRAYCACTVVKRERAKLIRSKLIIGCESIEQRIECICSSMDTMARCSACVRSRLHALLELKITFNWDWILDWKKIKKVQYVDY